ncbi:MAG: ABC transporter ATP-binding protein [Candidatus Heimdallarchaeota archaeon]
MKSQSVELQNFGGNSEFSLEDDDFYKARQKGVGPWILKHIFYRSNKYLMILFFSLIILTSFIGSFIYIIIGKAIDTFSWGSSDHVINYTFIVLLIGLGTPTAGLLARTFREIVAQRIERDVRKEFYLSLLGKSQSFHDNQRIGDIMARATNDVRFLNFLISPALAMLIDATINLIVPTVLIGTTYRLELMLLPLIFSIIFIFYLRYFLKKLAPPTIARRIAFGFMNTVLNESLSGIEVVKSMAREEDSVEKYKESALSYRDAGIEQGDIQAKYLPLLFLSVTVTLGLIIGVVYNNLKIVAHWSNQPISTGDVIAMVGLLLRLRFPVNASIRSFLMAQEAIVGARRLLESMNAQSEIYDSSDAVSKEIFGSVKFENVTFSYPGTQNKVLKNISFEVKEGQTVAIVGTTGSGKTTLTKLISRLYDVDNGRVLIDGIDVRNISLQSLRDQIAYIEQDIFIFSDSLLDNISFGRETTEQQVIEVAQEAQAHQFIKDLPDMYQTEVGERGVQLSGGERQRVAIARAFLADPKILILDDSSSAIDSETEEKIQEAIFKILRGRTTFIITHRLSQIRWADLILVLNQGEIVNQGSHEYLLKNSKEYQKIFIKRFDKTLNELLGVN